MHTFTFVVVCFSVSLITRCHPEASSFLCTLADRWRHLHSYEATGLPSARCLMDIARLEALERQIEQLIRAFIRIKEENTHLTQNLAQFQQMLPDQQYSLERWLSDQEELASLRTITQTLRQERELIRTRLEELLVIVERLERFSHTPSDSRI